jgi:hypothetical protein
MASVAPLIGPEAPVQGGSAEDATETGTTTRVDGEVYHPSLEMPGGEDEDLLLHLLADMVVEHSVSPTLRIGISEPEDARAAGGHGVEETGATDATYRGYDP